jgi:hypothetical protein
MTKYHPCSLFEPKKKFLRTFLKEKKCEVKTNADIGHIVN